MIVKFDTMPDHVDTMPDHGMTKISKGLCCLKVGPNEPIELDCTCSSIKISSSFVIGMWLHIWT